MRIQLWSYNYDPEPTGIGPLAGVLARGLAGRGHDVEVVSAHPHYPKPVWGTRLVPYRENRDGIPVIRLPIWPGRDTAISRVRQELSFTLPLLAAVPALRSPDTVIAVSPSFPALAPVMAFSRVRRVPWVLWLQDILPDGATATGLIEDGRLIRLARRFELAAYRSAHRIVVISDSFRENLLAKGIPERKIARVYNPATRPVRSSSRPESRIDDGLVLNMGNIGHSQDLEAVVAAFQDNPDLRKMRARLTLAGEGVAADAVRSIVRTSRISITGIVDSVTLDDLLVRAALGLVSQSYDGVDFNVPSKLSNFLGSGVPVIAAVRPQSEVARIVNRAGAGWVAGSPSESAATVAAALANPAERLRRSEAGLSFAREELTADRVVDQVERVIAELALGGSRVPA